MASSRLRSRIKISSGRCRTRSRCPSGLFWRNSTGSNWKARSYPNAPYRPRCGSSQPNAAAISRSALNTVGRRLRSSSVKGWSVSWMTTLTSVGGSAVTGWPVLVRAAQMTGRTTRPRSFRARAVTRRPVAMISAHGSAYAMCQRLYRPGYSIPELSTPPRRSSTSVAIRPSSAGSNGVAVRVTRTPPRVSSSVRWESTMAPRVRAQEATGKSKRPPGPGRSLRFLSAMQRAAYWRRHHCRRAAVRVTGLSVADRLAPCHRGRPWGWLGRGLLDLGLLGLGLGRARRGELGHPPGGGRAGDELRRVAQPALRPGDVGRGGAVAGEEADRERPDRGVAEQAAVEGGHEDHVPRPGARGQRDRVGERYDREPGHVLVAADRVEVTGADLADRVEQLPRARATVRGHPADQVVQRVEQVAGHGGARLGQLARLHDRAEQDDVPDRDVRVPGQHRVDAEGALAFCHHVDGYVRVPVHPLQLDGHPVAERLDRQVALGLLVGNWVPCGVQALVGELADEHARLGGA